MNIRIEFDQNKNNWNIRERNISFEMVYDFDFTTAIRAEDKRKNYGEQRIVAHGFIEERLYVLCFKPLGENYIRIISLRKANKREIKIYEKTINQLN